MMGPGIKGASLNRDGVRSRPKIACGPRKFCNRGIAISSEVNQYTCLNPISPQSIYFLNENGWLRQATKVLSLLDNIYRNRCWKRRIY